MQKTLLHAPLQLLSMQIDAAEMSEAGLKLSNYSSDNYVLPPWHYYSCGSSFFWMTHQKLN